jgi:hypothetical protein
VRGACATTGEHRAPEKRWPVRRGTTLHGELLVKLAGVLKVSTDEILGLGESRPSRAPRDRRLLRRLQDLDKLSKRDREALLRTLDAFLAKAQPG